ncbi:hypothetical protein BH18ACI4_BH18ACI4_20020 [soil metagenome]
MNLKCEQNGTDLMSEDKENGVGGNIKLQSGAQELKNKPEEENKKCSWAKRNE